MDHAVPQELLFHGVLNSSNTPEQAEIITSSEHTLSRWVLSLRPETHSIETLLSEEVPATVRLNLLNGVSPTLPRATKDLLIPELGNLSLTGGDIAQQLTEDILANKGWGRFSLPLKKREEAINLTRTREPTPQGALHLASVEPINVYNFAPTQVPEDIFAYFDFPEEEARATEVEMIEMEEEVFEFLELDAVELTPEDQSDDQIYEEPVRPRFRWPTISFPSMPSLAKPQTTILAVASFLAVSFIFVLPLHAMNVVSELRQTRAQLEQTGANAAALLEAGTQAALAQNGAQAEGSFAKAGKQFSVAAQAVKGMGVITNSILAALPGTSGQLESGTALIEAGQQIAIAGERMAQGYTAIEKELSPTPISRLNILEVYLSSALPHLIQAQSALAKISPENLSADQADKVAQLASGLPVIIGGITEFQSLYEIAAPILGAQGTKRYLIVFQNNTEIRPTGGFIGSFAEIKVHDGIVEHMSIPGGGSYDLQGTLTENLVAPEPLQLISARWEFQDGNWFPDFPTSARQLMQFYQSAGGPSVDGVLAINATYVADLIGLLGPITMEDYGRVIDQENFIFEAQKVVEYEYDKIENKPKAFIGDLAPKLVERALEKTSDDFLGVIDFLNKGLSEKDVQFYAADEVIQREVIARGWGGEVKWTDRDYLMLVDTNLGGGKTDGVIKQEMDVHVQIQDDGSIVNTVTVDRTHYGIRGLLFTGVNNVDYMRLYVPKGSELLAVDGFEKPDDYLFQRPDEDWIIDDDLLYTALTQQPDTLGADIFEEQGKQVFGGFVQTQPGTSSRVSFSYRLPFTVDVLNAEEGMFTTVSQWLGLVDTDQYSLLIQKQPGVLERTTNVRIDLPERLKTLWSTHELDQGTQFENDTDVLISGLFEAL